MGQLNDAYLDIETTGLSRFYNYITIIGIYSCKGEDSELIQLVGSQITRDNLSRALETVNTIYTYNGSRFDLPFINRHLKVNLEAKYYHHDLMYDCWQNNLYGGFKAIERKLGIYREIQDIDGFEATVLWQKYKEFGDEESLRILLKYNEEDVVNLRALRRCLREL